ncbi:MAG: type IV secretory system conjugative DNA transfer family protein [Dehalococcoidia bacterium]
MDAEIVLGTDVATGSPVTLGLAERQQGTYVIGKPGTGKTTLIEHMVVQDIERGLGVCVLDPHGDLIDAVLSRIPQEREHDVILLDAADTEFPFGLNLFECSDLGDRALVGRVATQAVEVFEKLWGETSWGPQLAQVLRNCAYTMVENQGYTLTEVRRLLTDDEFRARLVANLTLPQAREFWELEYNPLPKREQLQRVSSTLNKVDEFLTPAVYPIVGFGRTTVDFRRAMDDGQVVLVKLPVGKLGGPQMSLLGSIIVAQIFNAALSRQDMPPDARRQFNLFADEYHRFATPTFADLLAEARKYGLATTLAHQFRDQLDSSNRGATLTAGNLVVFAVGGEDAEELAKQFDRKPPEPEVIGQRPRLSISKRPVEHLVRNGHTADVAREAVSGWLGRLARLATELHDGAAYEINRPRQSYRSSPEALKDGVRELDEYLVEMMEHRIELNSQAEMRRIANIIVTLRAYIGFAPELHEVMGRTEYPFPAESLHALLPFIDLMIRAFDETLGHVQPKEGKRARDMMREVAPRLREARLRYWQSRHWEAEQADANQMRALEEMRAVFPMAFDIHSLGRELRANPILVDSGQWEPIFDRRRSYADVEAEIASELVNLPKFRARSKLLTGNGVAEHTLQISPPPSRAAPTSPPVLPIRERSRRVYAAPLADVLDRVVVRGRQSEIPDQAHATRRVRL